MEQLAERVFVETGYDGVNVGAVLTRKGFVCIDAPSYPRDTRDWLTQLHQFDTRPVTFVILTGCHGDRVLNTRWFGAPMIAHRGCAVKLDSLDKRYPQPFVDSLVARNPLAGRELSVSPVERVAISFSHDMTLFNVEAPLHIINLPGPSEDTALVQLPKEGVVFTGDLLVAETHPSLVGARIAQWLSSLRVIEELTAQGYVVVPGRGPVGAPGTLPKLVAFLSDLEDRMFHLAETEMARSDFNQLVAELIECFPLGTLPKEWARTQLRLGLEYLYEEARARPGGRRAASRLDGGF